MCLYKFVYDCIYYVRRYRHLMLNVVDLMPHCKKDNKVDSKSSNGATLNELVELKNCSSCMFFEVSFLIVSFWPCLAFVI